MKKIITVLPYVFINTSSTMAKTSGKEAVKPDNTVAILKKDK